MPPHTRTPRREWGALPRCSLVPVRWLGHSFFFENPLILKGICSLPQIRTRVKARGQIKHCCGKDSRSPCIPKTDPFVMTKKLDSHIYKFTCMYVFIYTCICTYIYIYICTDIYVYLCIYIYLYTFIRAFPIWRGDDAHTYTYTYIYTYIYICIYICIYIHIYIYVCIYIHLYIYVCSCTPPRSISQVLPKKNPTRLKACIFTCIHACL